MVHRQENQANNHFLIKIDLNICITLLYFSITNLPCLRMTMTGINVCGSASIEWDNNTGALIGP